MYSSIHCLRLILGCKGMVGFEVVENMVKKTMLSRSTILQTKTLKVSFSRFSSYESTKLD